MEKWFDRALGILAVAVVVAALIALAGILLGVMT